MMVVLGYFERVSFSHGFCALHKWKALLCGTSSSRMADKDVLGKAYVKHIVP